MENSQDSSEKNKITVEHLVPTKKAYILAFVALFISGILGGLIGFAMMKVFLPDQSTAINAIGTCVITVLIVYGMSVITSLGLQASVEWKTRKNTLPSSKRPSRFVKTEKLENL